MFSIKDYASMSPKNLKATCVLLSIPNIGCTCNLGFQNINILIWNVHFLPELKRLMTVLLRKYSWQTRMLSELWDFDRVAPSDCTVNANTLPYIHSSLASLYASTCPVRSKKAFKTLTRLLFTLAQCQPNTRMHACTHTHSPFKDYNLQKNSTRWMPTWVSALTCTQSALYPEFFNYTGIFG